MDMSYTRQSPPAIRAFAKALLVLGVREARRNAIMKELRTGRVSEVLERLFWHPGYLRLRAWTSFVRHRRRGIPLRQALAFDALLRITQFNRSIGAETVLNAGTLLGAVRQGAFAGRPGDLDLFVLHELGIDDYVARLAAEGSSFGIRANRHKVTALGPAKLKLRAPIKVDVLVLAAHPSEAGAYKPQRVFDKRGMLVEWPGVAQALRAEVFGQPFFIPDNFVSILERYYGEGWPTSSGAQHSIRTPHIERSASAG